MEQLVSRRTVFHGLGAIGVAVALAACAGGDDGAEAPKPGTELTTVDEVPVGGGVILGEVRVVVTQPSEGEFKAFTAVCPHQANTVTSVADGVIECSHHGSSFSAATGAVEGGPAPSPLAEVEIRLDGDRVLVA